MNMKKSLADLTRINFMATYCTLLDIKDEAQNSRHPYDPNEIIKLDFQFNNSNGDKSLGDLKQQRLNVLDRLSDWGVVDYWNPNDPSFKRPISNFPSGVPIIVFWDKLLPLKNEMDLISQERETNLPQVFGKPLTVPTRGDIFFDKNKDIAIRKTKSKCYLLFRHESGNELYAEVPIFPQAYRILHFLKGAQKSRAKMFTALELRDRGLADHDTTILNRITEIHKICVDLGQPKILHDFPSGKWGLNPDLSRAH